MTCPKCGSLNREGVEYCGECGKALIKKAFLTTGKDYLWRPYEIHSNKSVEEIEAELNKRVIQEPAFHLLPYYDKLYGKIENGQFVINYKPASSVYSRGAGQVTISGAIESKDGAVKIHGLLPGPPFAVWALALGSIGMWLFALKILIFQSINKKSNNAVVLLASVLTVFCIALFFIDRFSDKNSENKVLEALREAAEEE
jgi:hypothetical protein